MIPTRPTILRVGVVVPAHNEANTLPGTLRGLRAAIGRVRVPVSVLVVLDDCSDDSAAICAHEQAPAVRVGARNVGRARAAGCSAVLDPVIPADRQWLASTDADSVVPVEWLSYQLELADRGADVVAGTVALAPDAGLPTEHRHAFGQAYAAHHDEGGHLHAHGANLGFRASAYLAVGGFRPLAAHEDRDLLDRFCRDPEWRVERVTASPVLTSARRRGRAPTGLARDLSALVALPKSAQR